MLIGLVSCTSEDTPWDFGNGGNGGNGGQIDSLPVEDLSAAEREAILYMVEEEKLARDVYITLYGKFNQRIFNNISKAEQRHYDMLDELIVKYNLVNPVKNMGVGQFANPDLQKLYYALVEAGSKSESDALLVGAEIEDLDIADILEYLEDVDNEDITVVLNNLEKGSENHLRAFYKNLQNYGITYSPKYISRDLFDDIINGSNGNGGGNGDGDGNGGGRGHGHGRGRG
jgi:hypothetical protein